MHNSFLVDFCKHMMVDFVLPLRSGPGRDSFDLDFNICSPKLVKVHDLAGKFRWTLRLGGYTFDISIWPGYGNSMIR